MSLPHFLIPTKPFSPTDRRIVFLLGIVAFVAGYGGAQMAHTLPYARLSLDMTEGNMSMIFAIVRAVSLLAVGFSIVADRQGRKDPLIAAFGLLALGSLLTAFVPSTVVYVASQSVVRISVIAIAALWISFRFLRRNWQYPDSYLAIYCRRNCHRSGMRIRCLQNHW